MTGYMHCMARYTAAALLVGILLVTSHPAFGESTRLDYAGSLGGLTFSVGVEAPYACFVEGRDFQVVDLSDPSNPRRLGSLKLKNLVSNLIFEGKWVYATIDDDLGIINLEDVRQPRLVATRTDIHGYILALRGTRLCSVDEKTHTLCVADVSNPAKPVLQSTMDLPGSPSSVAISGQTVIVAMGEGGLSFIDVSSPSKPRVRAAMELINACHVVVDSTMAYVACGEEAKALLLDLSDPDRPRTVRVVDMEEPVYRIAYADNRLYLGHGQRDIVIFDVSNPYDPVESGRKTFEFPPVGMEPDNELLITAAQHGIRVLDVGNPKDIKILSKVKTLAFPKSMAVYPEGQAIFVSDESGRQLHRVDVANPTSPRIVESLPLKGRTPTRLSISGERLYQIEDRDIRSYLLTQSATTTRKRFISRFLSPNDIVARDNIVYTIDSYLRIYDFPADSTPVSMGKVQFEGNITFDALALSGERAFAAGMYRPLVVFDVANPRNPSIQSITAEGAAALDVAASTNCLYLAQGDEGISVFDIAGSAIPVRIGGFKTDMAAKMLALSGSILLAGIEPMRCKGKSAIIALDVSNPRSMRELARFEDTHCLLSLAAQDDIVYAGDARWGLIIMRMTGG